MRKQLFLLLILVSALCTGCTKCRCCLDRYQIQADGISEHGPLPTTYCLQPGANTNTMSVLTFKEIALYLQGVLAAQGYQEVAPEFAEIIVYLDLTKSGPILRQKTVSSLEPVLTTSYETKKNKESKVKEAITWTPVNKIVTTTHYLFQVSISAFLNTDPYNNINRELWTLALSSETTDSDERLVLPALIVSGAPFIGINTQKKIIYTLYLDDALSTHLIHYAALGKDPQSYPKTLHPTQDPLTIKYQDISFVQKVLESQFP